MLTKKQNQYKKHKVPIKKHKVPIKKHKKDNPVSIFTNTND